MFFFGSGDLRVKGVPVLTGACLLDLSRHDRSITVGVTEHAVWPQYQEFCRPDLLVVIDTSTVTVV
jgi:hypothetical protein